MSSANFLEKMMETMMMEMFNNQRKEPSQPCSNRTCLGKSDKRSKRIKRHHRHCKKKSPKCSTDVASIICVTKCARKCKKPQEKKCPDPCCSKRKCAQITCCCSSDSSALDHRYCSKCGQPLPGSTGVTQMTSPNKVHSYREKHSEIQTKRLGSPAGTCISCLAQAACSPCDDSTPFRSQQNMVGQCAPECNFFGPPYFFGTLNNSKIEGGEFTDDNRKKRLVQVARNKRKGLTPCSSNEVFSASVSDEDSDHPTAVRIKKCGKNIVTVQCEGGGFKHSRKKIDKNVGKNRINGGHERNDLGNGSLSQAEKTQCSRRFIQITEDQRSHYAGDCVTNVRCADYSSFTSGGRMSRANGAEIPKTATLSVPDPSNPNIRHRPCIDRTTSGIQSHPALADSMAPHVVRIKLVNPCDQADKFDSCCEIHEDSYESDCDKQPCTCYTENTSRPVIPFCYDQSTNRYEDEPIYKRYCPPNTSHSVPPSSPLYNDPYEYRPNQRMTSSESSSVSTGEESIRPDGRYGYDFFYGSVKPFSTK